MSRFRSIIRLQFPACWIALFLLFHSQAWATYPGQNGRIAFVGNFSGSWQVYTINPDGSDLFQVTNLPATELAPDSWFPNYSPDGQQIAFSHDMTGAVELYVVNVDGTGLTQITHDDAENLFPQWSPDGAHILFSAQYIGDRFDFHRLATVRPDGSDRRVITNSLFDDIFPESMQPGQVFHATRFSALTVAKSPLHSLTANL